jgi:hypothetical protein
MDLKDLRSSKFLKQSDVGAGVLVTINKIGHQNVAMEGAEPDEKAVVYFTELDKPLVLNSTNGQIIAKISGHDTDIEKNWIGLRVVLYTDPNVSFGGKIVGGIRVRAPRQTAGTKTAQAPAQAQTPAQENTEAGYDVGEPLPF